MDVDGVEHGDFFFLGRNAAHDEILDGVRLKLGRAVELDVGGVAVLPAVEVGVAVGGEEGVLFRIVYDGWAFVGAERPGVKVILRLYLPVFLVGI